MDDTSIQGVLKGGLVPVCGLYKVDDGVNTHRCFYLRSVDRVAMKEVDDAENPQDCEGEQRD